MHGTVNPIFQINRLLVLGEIKIFSTSSLHTALSHQISERNLVGPILYVTKAEKYNTYYDYSWNTEVETST
jgi:hypothetical protein